MCYRQSSINENRDGARRGVKRFAEYMVNKSNKKFKSLVVGDTVLVNVPRFDRNPLDLRNIIGKILAISNELYQVGTSVGIVANWLPRNALEESTVTFDEQIPNVKLGLREIATRLSPIGGQGVKKCNCKTRCSGQKCYCKKNKLMCNSRCHPSRSCLNK